VSEKNRAHVFWIDALILAGIVLVLYYALR
jgi:hypothetical protein